MPATGSAKYIIVCQGKSPNSGNSTSPCATIGAQRYEPVMVSAFVLDPGSSFAELNNLQNYVQVVPFDYQHAGLAFAFGLTMVLTFWLTAKPIGMMLELVRKG